MEPLVSIIIPVFNRAHLIGETLESIAKQSYMNWECLVIDDGSTDNTHAVVTDFCQKDSRFALHHRPVSKPKGANACRNYGLDICKGEYVNFFDSDDLMLPEKLQQQILKLHESEFYYCVCQTSMYDTNLNKDLGVRNEKIQSENAFKDFVMFNIFWMTGAVLWKKSFLKQHKLVFDEKLQQSQDYDFHMRALYQSSNYIALDTILMIYTCHGENMSVSFIDSPKKVYSNAKVKRQILERYKTRIDLEFLRVKYKELVAFYKLSLRNREFGNASFIMQGLLKNRRILKLSILKEAILILKIYLSFFFFFLLRKGDSILKNKDLR